MRLPRVGEAEVPPGKILDYLLSFSHPAGRSKAEFFSRFGFTRDRWELLAIALLRHASAYEAIKVEDTEFGTKYTIDGPLDAPDRRAPYVRVIWFVEEGETTPRFVTASPARRRSAI